MFPANQTTVAVALARSTQFLQSLKIKTARLDALVLLEIVMNKDKAWLLAHDDTLLDLEQVTEIQQLLARREKHEPIAYIRGYAEFYGRPFMVNEHVLVPRPESEAMIDMLKDIAISSHPAENLQIIDIGTGSGCLAITAALEVHKATVIATDVSTNALHVAQTNALDLHADVTFVEANWLEPRNAVNTGAFSTKNASLTFLLCNLPYVPENYTINMAATHEPPLALFAGDDGLQAYRELFVQLKRRSILPAAILTESLVSQHESLTKLAKNYGYKVSEVNDLVISFVRA